MIETNDVYIAHKDKKTGRVQTVAEHLTETAKLAESFANKIGLGKCGQLMGLFHDFGKYSDEFQKRINENGAKCDHSTVGAQVLRDILEKDTVSDVIELCVMAHHGGLFNMLEVTEGTSAFQDRLFKQMNKEVICRRGAEQVETAKAVEAVLSDEVSEMYQKLKGLNAENTSEFMFFQSLLTKFLYSCLIDADRLNTIQFPTGKVELPRVSWTELAQVVDAKVASFESTPLNEVRAEIYTRCKEVGSEAQRIFKLNAPTGGGKTLASLRFAVEQAKTHNLERIIYVLPYTAIIEQNAQVVRDILKESGIDTQVLLESHSNIDISDEADYTRRGLTSNWETQIVFTTIVSFYESIFAGGTKNIRRLHNMANSVIIFDEVQSLPIKLIHMSNMLMRFLQEVCGSTILLCSATQPLLDKIKNEKRRLTPAKNIVDTQYPVLERVEIINRLCNTGYSNSQIAQMVYTELEQVNNALVVVNTRRAARELYDELSLSGYKVYHLSTYLCAAHRSKIIQCIKDDLANNERVICVATQLIEAGVDIDFACVFRMIAGLDSIIQCAGRCNREGKLEDANGNLVKGKVYIVNSDTENTDSLKDIREGQEVLKRVLRECGEVLSDRAIELYYKYYFYNRHNDMAYNVTSKAVGITTDLFELFSKNQVSVNQYRRENKIDFPYKLRQAFGTVGTNFKVINNEQIGLIVPYDKGKDIIANLDTMTPAEILRNAQRYTVNVFKDKLKELPVEYKYGVCYVTEDYYDDVTGLK